MNQQSEISIEQPLYCIDTSSLLELRRSYPQDIFEPLHKSFSELLTSGKMIILDVVLEELKKKEPEIHKYIKQIIPKERLLKFDSYIIETQELIHTYYDNRGQSHTLKADPHIIACAKTAQLTVVTEEYNSDPTKIPAVCSQEKIKCINFIDLLREENIRF